MSPQEMIDLFQKHVGAEVDAAALAPFKDLVEQNSREIKEILP